MRPPLRRLLALLLVGFSCLSTVWAQTAPPSNLSGSNLRTWLRQNWYDGKRVVLDYGTARGRMYNYIDNYNNKVTCVYSGYEQSFTFSETGTSTSIPNINCEHTVPQSWFDEAVRMRSDIHHLFPTVEQWNSDRGSDPFAEIPDSQTTKWIRLMASQATVPASNIDEYSEDTNSQFEPREVHKGNLARAVFYFYTMHEGQSFDPGTGTPSAVGAMETLYQWHLQDPVDDRERERNNRVERVQGNRNPYIDYPELVASAWGFTPPNCSPATQASQVSITEATQTSFKVNWANGSGNRRLVVVRDGSAASFSPSGSYSTGINADFSQATDQANGNKIVYSGSGTSVTVTGLLATHTYYVKVFEFCSTDNTYNTTSAPTAQTTLPNYTCSGVPAQLVTNLASAGVTTTGFNLTFTAGSGDSRVLVIKEGSAPTAVPQAGTAYANASANYANAPTLSDGSRVVYSGSGSGVNIIGLKSNADYYVVAFESCSNGWQYAAGTSTLQVHTEMAGGNLPAGAVARQDFENSADDGWEVLSGFSSSSDNSGVPDGQRIHGGTKSFQLAPPIVTPTTAELVFGTITTTGYKDLAIELFNSSISKSTGNGIDAGDYIEVYTALNGAAFTATPDVRITASANNTNARYGMNGTGVVETTAGTPVTKTIELTNELAGDDAPSRVIVRVPNGTASVQLKVILKINSDKEVLNIDDVTLYGTTITGISKELEQQFRMYPNPSSGTVVVEAPAELNLTGVKVFNSVGQLVLTQQPEAKNQPVSLHLQHLPKGIYLVHLTTNQGTLLRRLVLQ